MDRREGWAPQRERSGEFAATGEEVGARSQRHQREGRYQ